MAAFAVRSSASMSKEWMVLLWWRSAIAIQMERLDRRVGQRRDATRAPTQARSGWWPPDRLLVSPLHHLRTTDILSKRWGPPHSRAGGVRRGTPQRRCPGGRGLRLPPVRVVSSNVQLQRQSLFLLSRTEYQKCAVFLLRDLETQRVHRLYDSTKSLLLRLEWPTR